MRFLCVHCDQRFESDDEKPRCPKCMRVHGIEKLEALTSKAEPTSRKVQYGIFGAVLAVVIGGYVYWSQQATTTVTGEVPLHPLDASELAAHLKHLRADLPFAKAIFADSDAVEAFAEKATAGKSSDADKVSAVVKALQAKRAAHAFEEWSRASARQTEPMTPNGLAGVLNKNDARAHLYPIELALFATVALRSVDVPVLVAEIGEVAGQRVKDPSGTLGYYGVALYADEPGNGAAQIYDVYAGGPPHASTESDRVLTDTQALGALAAVWSSHLMNQAEAPRALSMSNQAIALDARSASVRSTYGGVLVASGQAQQGLAEFESALQLRTDAPRRHGLASIAMALGDAERAKKELDAALEASPEFASAYATRAAIAMTTGDFERANEDTQKASSLDPQLPTLLVLRARLAAQDGDLDKAVGFAEQSAEENPKSVQALLFLAQLYRQLDRYSDMQATARKILALVPSADKARVEEILKRQLGQAALADEPPAPELEDEELAGDDDSLRLGQDSKLLGEPGSNGPRPRLLDQDLGAPGVGGGSPGTSLRLGEGGGGGLRLNLND